MSSTYAILLKFSLLFNLLDIFHFSVNFHLKNSHLVTFKKSVLLVSYFFTMVSKLFKGMILF